MDRLCTWQLHQSTKPLFLHCNPQFLFFEKANEFLPQYLRLDSASVFTKFRIPIIFSHGTVEFFFFVFDESLADASPMTEKFRITASIVFSSILNFSSDKPLIYRRIFATASRMSRMRISSLLGGTYHFPFYLILKLRTNRILNHQIDGASKNTFEKYFYVKKMKKTDVL